MGTIHRQVGPHDRHENFRGLGAAKRTAEKVRLRAGQSGGGCKGIARQKLEMMAYPRSRDFLGDSTARTLVAGDLEAVFLPAHGMLGASLRHRGVELLRRVEDLEAAAARGSSAGIPLLYPWANRLSEPRSEERRVGKECRSRWSPYH